MFFVIIPLVIYTLIYYCLLPFLVIHTLLKNKQSVWQKLGFFYQPHTLKHPIHLHCVSLGEVNACKRLISLLLVDHPIIITSTTATGYQAAYEFCQDKQQIQCYYFPFDIPFAVKRYLNQTKPMMSIMFETEIWVNFSHIAHHHGIKLALINARLSQRSYKKYHIFSKLTSTTLACFDLIATQNNITTEYFKQLGYHHPITLPSIKFDVHTALNKTKLDEVKALIQGRKALVCASTHHNEEEMIIQAYLGMTTDFILVLIPRHSSRFKQVESILRQTGVAFTKQSNPVANDTRIILADSIGYVREFYSQSTVAFIGGSLVSHIGGHNMLEAMAFNTLVLSGKHTFNFELSAELVQDGALLPVNNALEICEITEYYIGNPSDYKQHHQQATRIINRYAGATQSLVTLLRKYLPVI